MEPEDQNDGVVRELRKLDVCGGSVLHALFTRLPTGKRKETFLKSYLLPWVITSLLFYGLPLIVALVTARNILFSGPNPTLYLFSASSEVEGDSNRSKIPEDMHKEFEKFQTDLNKGKIPEVVRQGFEKKKLPLSQDVTVSVEEKGRRWLITDNLPRTDKSKKYEKKYSRYSVKKEESKLEIHHHFPVGFLSDWNFMFMNLVTLPVLVILLLSERSMVPRRIATIIRGRTSSDYEAMAGFVSRWNGRYRKANLLGQFVGVAAAVGVVLVNHKATLQMDVASWPVTNGSINAAGYVYEFWSIPFFYLVATIYTCQGIATIILLFSLVQKFKIKVSPFHHDNCCGLRAVGQIGLRNQYLLAVVGINLLALLAVNIKRGDPGTAGLLVGGFVAYLILGPIVFIGPLLPFRKSMQSARESEQARVATKLQYEYTRIMDELENRSIAKEDEELIDRLQKLKALVNRIPVWPFDISTLRRFVTVYILPFLTVLVSILINYLIGALKAM